MKKWEYMCQRLRYDRSDIEQGLDELGKKGWELVGTGKVRCGFGANDETLILFFKREIPEPPAELTTDEDISACELGRFMAGI